MTLRTVVSAALVALLMVMVTDAARGQAEVRHEGFWFAVGAGGGWNVTQNVNDESAGGGAFALRLGGTPHPKVLLGFEALTWWRDSDDVLLTRGNGTLIGVYYPRDYGVYLKAGVGGSSVRFEEAGVATTETGAGTTIGLGYDFRLGGGNIYITPALDFMFQVISGSENSILLLTISATWH